MQMLDLVIPVTVGITETLEVEQLCLTRIFIFKKGFVWPTEELYG